MGSGEYALERPPKKPGGTSRTIFFLLGVFVSIDGIDGGQPVDEFDDETFSEGGTEAIEDDLSSEGGTWMFLGKAWLAVTLLIFLLFRERLRRLWCEWSIAMEVMAPLTVALEKFVVRYKINRTNVPMMRSVLMAKLTREFTCFAEEDPGRKVALLFSNIEREMNTLCAEGDLKREDAVELHFKKLWQLNKSHVSREKTEAEGRKTRFDIWSVLVVAVMSLLFENIRSCLREHGFIFAAGITVSILLVNQHKVLEKCRNIHNRMRQCLVGVRVSIQQEEVTVLDSNYTLKDLFASELEGFLKHIKYDGIIPQEDLLRVLWDRFDMEVRIFG